TRSTADEPSAIIWVGRSVSSDQRTSACNSSTPCGALGRAQRVPPWRAEASASNQGLGGTREHGPRETPALAAQRENAGPYRDALRRERPPRIRRLRPRPLRLDARLPALRLRRRPLRLGHGSRPLRSAGLRPRNRTVDE